MKTTSTKTLLWSSLLISSHELTSKIISDVFVMRVEFSLANHSVAPSCVGVGWRRAAIKNVPTPSGTRSLWLLCPAAERHGWRTPSITVMTTYRCDGRRIRPSQRTACDPDSVRIQDRENLCLWVDGPGWQIPALNQAWGRLRQSSRIDRFNEHPAGICTVLRRAACVRHRESTASESTSLGWRLFRQAGACRNLYGALERPRFADGPGAGSVPSCTRTVAQVTRTPIWLGLRALCCLVLGHNSR
jgi:hypothetical protein